MSRNLSRSRFLHRIEFGARHPSFKRVAQWAGRALDTMLAMDLLNELYHDCSEGAPDPRTFLHRVLKWVRVRWRPDEADLARIPKTGPVVVVANHPFGAIEGIVLAATLLEVRSDVKLLANFLLDRVKELRDLFILVDPFQREHSARMNVAPLRQALRHLERGGVLAVFPAGEVASFDWRSRQIIDPTWSSTVARLIRRARCPVLPVFFEGHNSILFQSAGFVHPRLRSALLAREFFDRRGTRIRQRVGSPIPFKRLAQFEQDDELTAYLRQRTYLLQHRRVEVEDTDAKPQAADALETVVGPVHPNLLARDIEAIAPKQILVDDDESLVCHARATQIPNILRELGRLREITFRATGEGTGKSIDLDGFDQHYVHLFVWNKPKREVVGAYRLGATDEILTTYGQKGLYTSTLFEIKPELLSHITPALELGRSFVRGEYQRSFSPLLLLWKGIGQYIVRHPRYKFLFGPVSITNAYQSVSKQLMVRFLKENHCPPDLVELVQARNPFRLARIAGWDRSAFRLIRDSDDVSDLVADVEPQSRGIPVLLRQYLKLGAKLLAFNVDPAFADCVDALMVCDLSNTDPRMLDRYMGKAGRETFIDYHSQRARRVERMETANTSLRGQGTR
jgi:putative hemolysin